MTVLSGLKAVDEAIERSDSGRAKGDKAYSRFELCVALDRMSEVVDRLRLDLERECGRADAEEGP